MPSAQLCCSMAVDCMSDGMGMARKKKVRGYYLLRSPGGCYGSGGVHNCLAMGWQVMRFIQDEYLQRSGRWPGEGRGLGAKGQ